MNILKQDSEHMNMSRTELPYHQKQQVKRSTDRCKTGSSGGHLHDDLCLWFGLTQLYALKNYRVLQYREL